MKVLNLNAVAKHLTPDYKGKKKLFPMKPAFSSPLLAGPLISVSQDPLLKDVRAVPSLPKGQLSSLATEAFSSLACPPVHAALVANSGMGFLCDAVCVVDAASGSPVALADVGTLEDLFSANSASARQKWVKAPGIS